MLCAYNANHREIPTLKKVFSVMVYFFLTSNISATVAAVDALLCTTICQNPFDNTVSEKKIMYTNYIPISSSIFDNCNNSYSQIPSIQNSSWASLPLLYTTTNLKPKTCLIYTLQQNAQLCILFSMSPIQYKGERRFRNEPVTLESKIF